MLVQLISAYQAVLLSGNSKAWLFFQGKVYTRTGDSRFETLPRHEDMRPVWALIDMDLKHDGPPLPESFDVWPIQASSPKPIRWMAWCKQWDAALYGMPLWEEDDLVKGYAFSLFSFSMIASVLFDRGLDAHRALSVGSVFGLATPPSERN